MNVTRPTTLKIMGPDETSLSYLRIAAQDLLLPLFIFGMHYYGKRELEATRYHFIYSIFGLFVGLVCILGGLYLFNLGVTGSASWIFKWAEGESQLSNAAPGTILFVVGVYIVWTTRFKVIFGRK